MKFKGIELRAGQDSEAEVLVNVELLKSFDDENEMEEYIEEMEENIFRLFENYPEDVSVEAVYDDLLQVRCETITFDRNGVGLLADIHQVVSTANLENVDVTIGIHVDGDNWFKREDGSEYNEEVVSLEKFLENVEY